MPATEPVVVPATEPAVVPATEPVIVPATEPVIVPATEPVIVPATEPVIVPATEPVVVPATEPAIVPATEPAVVPACRILTSIKDIDIGFGKMTTEVENALINAKVNVSWLIKRLITITVVKNKKVPLFDEDVFEKVQSIDHLWKKLSKYWTIFDYEVLECVVKSSDCREAQDIFEDFISRIDPSKIEDADLVLNCKVEQWEGSLKPVLRIKVNEVNPKKCTKKVEKKIKTVVSKAYKLKNYTLWFVGIKEGCIEMIYCISKSLKLYLLSFPLTGFHMAEFLAHNIINLHINDTDDEFELKVPSKIVDMVSGIYQLIFN